MKSTPFVCETVLEARPTSCVGGWCVGAEPRSVAMPTSRGTIPVYEFGTVRPNSLVLSGRPPPQDLKKSEKKAEEKRIGGATWKSEGSGVARIAAPGNDQTAAQLTLGLASDFNFLKRLENRVLAGVPETQVGGPENNAMAAGVRKLLAAQPAWRDAPEIFREIQPLLVIFFLDKPRWLSSEDLELAETLGFVTRGPAGMQFKSIMDSPWFFPLLKVSLEPCDNMLANYELGIAWLRAQQLDPQREPSMYHCCLAEVVHHTVIEDFGTLHVLAERVKLARTSKCIFHVNEVDAERDGVRMCDVDIKFAGREDLIIRGALFPKSVLDAEMVEDKKQGKPPLTSADRLRANGFAAEAEQAEAKEAERAKKAEAAKAAKVAKRAGKQKAAKASDASSTEDAARMAAEIAEACPDLSDVPSDVMAAVVKEMGAMQVQPAPEGRGPQITPFARGVRVRISGLASRADLNGKVGVLGALRDNGRWACTVDGTGETVALRPDNLFPWKDEHVVWRAKAFAVDDRVEVMQSDGTWESGTVSSRRRVDGLGRKDSRPMLYSVELDLFAGEVELNSTDDQKRIRSGPTHLECALRSFGERAVARGQISRGAFEKATQLVERAKAADDRSEHRALMTRLAESWLPSPGTPVRLAMEHYRGRPAVFVKRMEERGKEGGHLFAIRLPTSDEGGILVPVELMRAEGSSAEDAAAQNAHRTNLGSSEGSSSMPARVAEQDDVELRFAVGTRVECNCGVWKAGTVVRHWYTQPSLEGRHVPYQVRLDEAGQLIFAPHDEDAVIRRLIEEPETDARSRRRRKAKKAPVLPNGANEPSRFQVGDRVEVKISRDSEPGSAQGVDMISTHNIAGGRWVPAKVAQLRYTQDDWCPGFYCAYAVKVHGDATPDGVQFATPVREDDERCIRAAPAAPRPAPPRFAVGTRVECNGGPLGWKAGVVSEIWPEAPSGVLMPYSVKLDAGGTALIPHDEDPGIRAVRAVA